MGWNFGINATRSEAIAEVRMEVAYNDGAPTFITGFACCGDVLWVKVTTFPEAAEPSVDLYAALLAKNDRGWGYKVMHVEEGPFYFTCPDRLREAYVAQWERRHNRPLVPEAAKSLFLWSEGCRVYQSVKRQTGSRARANAAVSLYLSRHLKRAA